jgi:hypothetical protein
MDNRNKAVIIIILLLFLILSILTIIYFKEINKKSCPFIEGSGDSCELGEAGFSNDVTVRIDISNTDFGVNYRSAYPTE